MKNLKTLILFTFILFSNFAFSQGVISIEEEGTTFLYQKIELSEEEKKAKILSLIDLKEKIENGISEIEKEKEATPVKANSLPEGYEPYKTSKQRIDNLKKTIALIDERIKEVAADDDKDDDSTPTKRN